MLAGKCERTLSEVQTGLYGGLHQVNDRATGLFLATVDVVLETVKPPLQAIECAILVILNLGGALAGHRGFSVKHAIHCAEEGLGSLVVFVATWFVLPPVPVLQISPVPVLRLLLQWLAVLRNPLTAESLYRWNAAALRRDSGLIEVDPRPAAHPAPYEAIPLNDPPPAGTSSAVIATTTPATASRAPADLPSVSLTESAANQYRDMLVNANKVGWGLRLGVKTVGKSSEHFLDFSEKPKAGDEIFESQGIQIHINQADVSRYRGSVINRLDRLSSNVRFQTMQSPIILPVAPPNSSMPSLAIEPAASATSSVSSTTATGLQTSTEPESPVTPPDKKKPDAKAEMSVSPGTF